MRLVKHAAANACRRRGAGRARATTPPSRPCATPASRIRASSACSSGASGVVCADVEASSPRRSRTPTVPITPRGSPAARRDRLEQVGGGGLAVGAGDAEHPHRRRRVAVQASPPADRARRARSAPGPAAPPSGSGPLDEQRDRAPRRRPRARGRGRRSRAPGMHAKHAPGVDPAAVVGDGVDLDVRSPELDPRLADRASRPARRSCQRTRARPLGSVTGTASGYRAPGRSPTTGARRQAGLTAAVGGTRSTRGRTA